MTQENLLCVGNVSYRFICFDLSDHSWAKIVLGLQLLDIQDAVCG